MSVEIAKAHSLQLDDYAPILGLPEIHELRSLAERLKGRSVQMVNSTAVGGGVAEILNRLIPILSELGLAIRWEVMTGGDEFFRGAKGFLKTPDRRGPY